MRKFTLKSLAFVLPFFIGYLLNLYMGATSDKDLLRMGVMINHNENYRANFIKPLLVDILYTDFSKQKKRPYTALVMGDSFSQQGNIGYQNFLSNNDNVSVLHYNESVNSIEMLHNFMNGNVLDSLQVDYVIIQSIQREFVDRANNFDSTRVINFRQAIKTDREFVFNKKKAKLLSQKPSRFFSSSTIKFPLFNMLYMIDDNAFLSPVYKVKTEKKLFSIKDNDLLFYEDDILKLESTNNFNQIKIANQRLNSLSKKLTTKGVQLIVLIAPDKYDLYYDYIIPQNKYPEPLFFKYWDSLPKNYININTKEILSNAIKSKKDIYFHDDTHWSSLASEILGKRIHDIITQKRSNKQE